MIISTNSKYSDLYQACLYGRFEKVSKLLDEGLDPNTSYGRIDRCTPPPLYAAVSRSTNYLEKEDYKKIISALICRGANVNALYEGETALYNAWMNKAVDTIKILMEKGANPDIPVTAEGTSVVERVNALIAKASREMNKASRGAAFKKALKRRNDYRGYKALFDKRSYSEPAKLLMGSKKFVDWILENTDKTHMIDGKAYNIVRHISSSGCYGDVFLAKEVGLAKIVAIKILRDSRDKEDEMLEMIRHKGGHSNIVEYYGSDLLYNRKWLLLEYVPGVTSSQYGPLSTEQETQYRSAIRFLRKIGVNTTRENERGNVLVQKNGRVVLIDFGTLTDSM